MATCNGLRLHHSLRGVYYILDHLKIFEIYLFVFYVYGFFICMYVCAQRSQKKVLGPLELELEKD